MDSIDKESLFLPLKSIEPYKMKFEILSIGTKSFENYIFLATTLFFFIQLLYYSILYSRLIQKKKSRIKGKISYDNSYPPVSIIISADDATKKLEKQLPLLLEQDYPEFEIIVINDSTDPFEEEATDELLKQIQKKHSNLYFSFTPKSARYISRKKLSLTLGVKASKYDWILFTEPGYCPTSNQWIKSIARNFTSSTDVVLSYGGYKEVQGWKNLKMIYDSAFNTIRYLSFALCKRPYKGYGKNLAYRKKLFYQNKGYSSHLNLLRGEDDIFINQMANSTNTRVELSPEAILKYQFDDQTNYWKDEKQNYILSSYFHKGNQQYILGFETGSRLFFYLFTIIGISLAVYFSSFTWCSFFFILWLMRYIIQAIILNKSVHILGYKRNYIFSLPIFDFWHPLYNIKIKVQLLFKGKRNYMRKE